jgi:hypothetical protein
VNEELYNLVLDLLDFFPAEEGYPSITIFTSGGVQQGFVPDELATILTQMQELVEANDNEDEDEFGGPGIEFELDPTPVRDDDDEE